jgi:hypothetical protein
MLEVIYGTCQQQGDAQFYAYVLRVINTGREDSARWLALGYAYLPESDPGAIKPFSPNGVACAPPDWTILSSKPLGDSWYDVGLSYPAQVPFFALTATAAAP